MKPDASEQNGNTNIVFIGLPGSGKSSYGKRLASDLKLHFADTDKLIEVAEGMPISEIFEMKGEEYFRDAETAVLRSLARDIADADKSYIVSVGGGTILRQENVAIMRKIGVIIFLDRSTGSIASRPSFATGRPLLRQKSDLDKLAAERRSYYEEAADIIFGNKGSYTSELTKLRKLLKLLGACGKMSLIGNPVAHSLSGNLHRVIFSEHGINGKYTSARVESNQLELVLNFMKMGGLKGFNVTKPHKVDVANFVDELDGDAALARAVNTVVLHRNNGPSIIEGKRQSASLVGHNTDMEGLLLAIKRTGRMYKGANITVLGAGGAARGIAFKVYSEGAANCYIINRGKLSDLRDSFPDGADFVYASFADADISVRFADVLANTDILINATPLGMSGWGSDFANLDFLEHLGRGALVCDLIYNPTETNFLREARMKGLDTINGLPMLIYQGILADELVFGIKPDRDALYDIVYRELSGQRGGKA